MGLSPTELVASGADADTYWEGVPFLGHLILVNGTDKYDVYKDAVAGWKADTWGSGATDPPPDSYFIEEFLGRIWLAPKDARHKVVYSQVPPDHDEFPSANEITIYPQRGGEVTGLKTWGAALYIFQSHNIVVIPFADDPTLYSPQNLHLGFGCVAPYTLRRCGPYGLVFMADDGIRVFPPGKRLSGLVDDTIMGMTASRKKASYGA